MSRNKLFSVVAGWLAVASVGPAQTPQVSGPKLSPYYPTASTVDRRAGEESELPPEMPNVPVPRASVPARPTSAGGQAPVAPPVTPPVNPPVAPPDGGAPAMGGAPATGGSCGPNGCGPACAPTCNTGGTPCGPDGRFWVSVEYLLWWGRGMTVPALVTASPLGTPPAAAGVPGDPRTVVLFGNETVNNDVQSGFRVRAGFWFDEGNTCGIEGSYFFLGSQSDNATFFPTNARPILARPFLNAAPLPGAQDQVNPPRPDSALVNFPGIVSGTVAVNTNTDFHGFDANLVTNLGCAGDYRVDFIAGYRYLQLNDSVTIAETLTANDPNNIVVPVGTRFLVQDSFQTRNQFNGGQVGLASEWRRGRVYVGARGLVALGNSHKQATINGTTFVTSPNNGGVQQNIGGLLAQPTNIGTYTHNDFAVVPEGTLTVGYQVTDGIRAFVGYTFLYWSNVWRAGDQIDPVVNTTQIPPNVLVGAPRPIFPAKDTDFWAQGINFGLEFRY